MRSKFVLGVTVGVLATLAVSWVLPSPTHNVGDDWYMLAVTHENRILTGDTVRAELLLCKPLLNLEDKLSMEFEDSLTVAYWDDGRLMLKKLAAESGAHSISGEVRIANRIFDFYRHFEAKDRIYTVVNAEGAYVLEGNRANKLHIDVPSLPRDELLIEGENVEVSLEKDGFYAKPKKGAKNCTITLSNKNSLLIGTQTFEVVN